MNVAPRSDAAAARRVLITGITGFTGRHLAPALAARGVEVHGTTQEPGADPCHHAVDLLDGAALADLVARLRPTHVVHLAAISFVAHGDADQLYRTNVVGTRNLLQALAAVEPGELRCVLLASSANIYGNAEVSPIDEDTPPRPANDYAVSKLAMEHMAALWGDRLPITIARPFNYSGVGQAPHFLVPKIVAAFRDRAPVLELGNLDVERDLSDVRDVVAAYRGLLEASPRGVFNVCSGTAVSLRSLLDEAARLTGHSPEIRVNPAFVRTNEVRRLCGSAERLRRVVPEWSARPFRDTLHWMLDSPPR